MKYLMPRESKGWSMPRLDFGLVSLQLLVGWVSNEGVGG